MLEPPRLTLLPWLKRAQNMLGGGGFGMRGIWERKMAGVNWDQACEARDVRCVGSGNEQWLE